MRWEQPAKATLKVLLEYTWSTATNPLSWQHPLSMKNEPKDTNKWHFAELMFSCLTFKWFQLTTSLPSKGTPESPECLVGIVPLFPLLSLHLLGEDVE